MRWIIVCVLLAITVPAWAAKKKNKVAQPEPQQTEQIQAIGPPSDQWNQKMCPRGIEDGQVLTTMNPFDNKGRCFNYQGGLVQMLNKGKGLFSFVSSREPFALVDFGKDSVPMNYWYGVVIGKGAYSYETVRGDVNNIFSFASVPKSKEREVWEKNKIIEKAKEEERQIAEKRARVEQEWMTKIEASNNPELTGSPLTLKDPATGLVWARNGNIAEKRMDWKEAREWVRTLNHAGYTDWRLPTKEEFEKFFKIKGRGKSTLSDHFLNRWLNKNGFFNVQETSYWSSTEVGDYRSYWHFDMFWSEMSGDNTDSHYVLPVHDGKKVTLAPLVKYVLWNKNICPQPIESMQTLFTLNPYDSKGRCFNYSGKLVQLLNKSQAFFSVLTSSTPFAFVDFGKESAPINFYSGVVLGKGAYSYQTAGGSKKVILSFVPVPKSKVREEWEIKQEEDKKIKEQEAANAKANLNEEWEKNPTYTDPSTGLMWTTSGNMGEINSTSSNKAGRSSMYLKEAVEWVNKLNYGGYSDWRLPTKQELLVLAKRGGYFPSEWLNSNGFHYVEARFYWTSTITNGYSNINNRDVIISTIDMSDGAEIDTGRNTSHYVWPVRDTNK